jgi:hypothetical protein
MDVGLRKSSFNMSLSRAMLFLVIIPFLSLSPMDSTAESHTWQKLAEGLYLGEFDPKMKSRVCNHKIVILKIDPKFYTFKLLCASEHDRKPRTAREWCNEFGLLAAINASMYQNMDPIKSTGYMKNYEHLNNSHINPAFGAFLCFNPVDSSLPEVQIIDRRLQKKWKGIIKRYNTVVQNYRMISNGEKRGWPQQEEIYGSAAIAMDKDNHVLFILSRSPFSTHNLIHILLSLPVHIENAIYLEGGPEATLYSKIGDKEITLVGMCKTDFTEQDDNESLHAIPNVIGVVKRRGGLDAGGN